MKLFRYERQGMLAIDPRAFFERYPDASGIPSGVTLIGSVAIVDIRGPLDNEAGYWTDSYPAIAERVSAACASPAQTVLLRVDSPGGEVAGCFDAARAIKAYAKEANKRLVAFVSGCSCSAAYALTAAAEQIVVAEAGMVGSIGILNTRLDSTAADAAYGMRFAIITSGARKADGNPHVPITDAELAEQQNLVNSLAGTFFALIAELRGVGVDQLAAMQARIFHGQSAVTAGLADQVQSFEGLLATMSGGAAMPDDEKNEYQEARAALGRLAGGEGEQAEAARRALAAMDDKGPGDEEEEEEGEGGEGASTAAEGDDPPADDETPKKKAKGSAARAAAHASVTALSAGDLAQTVQRMSARLSQLEAQGESASRTAFLATRPDLAKELRDVLATKSLADVKAIVNAIPKPKASLSAPTTTQGTRGKDQRSPGDRSTASLEGRPYAESMATAFGRQVAKEPVRLEGHTQIFEVMSVEEASKRAAALSPLSPDQVRERVTELHAREVRP